MDLFVRIGVNTVVGLLLQLLVALLLCSVFLAERARSKGAGGSNMGYWNAAWLAQAVAIAALVVHLLFLPNLDIQHLRESTAIPPPMLIVYASAKMVVWACLLSGCAQFQRPGVPARALRFLFVAGQLLAAGSFLNGTFLDAVVNYLFVVMTVASLCCAHAVAYPTPERRFAASRWLAVAFGFHTLELVGLTFYTTVPAPPEGPWIVTYNSYLDSGLQLALAACMIWVARSNTGPSQRPQCQVEETTAAVIAT